MSDAIVYCSKCHHHFGLLKNLVLPLDINRSHREMLMGAGNCEGFVKVHKPVYVGLFLLEHSKKVLLEMVKPRHPTIYAEHVTMAFGRHMNDQYLIGRRFSVQACEAYEDDRGQCVTIEPGGAMPFFWKEQIPHVTVSCAEKVKPLYSNDLLKAKLEPKVRMSLWLDTVLDYYPRTTA